MRKRKVHYVDVSKMSEKDLCKLLNIPYIPWYRSGIFWTVFLLVAMPFLLRMM
jgi:hypothetical protein